MVVLLASGLLTFGLLVEMVWPSLDRSTSWARRRRDVFLVVLASPILSSLALSLDGWRVGGTCQELRRALEEDDVEGVRACFADVVMLREGPVLNAPWTIDWIVGPRPWEGPALPEHQLIVLFDPLEPGTRWVTVSPGMGILLLKFRRSWLRWRIEGVYAYG